MRCGFHEGKHMFFALYRMMCADSGCIDRAYCAGEIHAFFDGPALQKCMGETTQTAVAAASGINGFDIIWITVEALFCVFEEAQPESRNGISARDGYAVVRSWAGERDQRSRAL